MKWVEKRDQLIAETLAFVKQVKDDQSELAAKLQAAVEPEIRAAANPERIVPSVTPKVQDIADLRKDIRIRVDAFKARQQTLLKEREQHYRQNLTRLRIELATANREADPKKT